MSKNETCLQKLQDCNDMNLRLQFLSRKVNYTFIQFTLLSVCAWPGVNKYSILLAKKELTIHESKSTSQAETWAWFHMYWCLSKRFFFPFLYSNILQQVKCERKKHISNSLINLVWRILTLKGHNYWIFADSLFFFSLFFFFFLF